MLHQEFRERSVPVLKSKVRQIRQYKVEDAYGVRPPPPAQDNRPGEEQKKHKILQDEPTLKQVVLGLNPSEESPIPNVWK